jgi:hypothetical protein
MHGPQRLEEEQGYPQELGTLHACLRLPRGRVTKTFIIQTTLFGAMIRFLFHKLLGLRLQLRRLIRWSSKGAREAF